MSMIRKCNGSVTAFLLLVTAVCLLQTGQARASQEGMLKWSSFTIESEGIGSSGPISVSGKQDSSGIKALRVRAFGRTYELSPAHLEDLKAMITNGMQLSYEGGYKDLGGRTLYVQLSSGFLHHVVIRKLVRITERGDITVEAWRERTDKGGGASSAAAPGAPTPRR
jgi:hypothetical protein